MKNLLRSIKAKTLMILPVQATQLFLTIIPIAICIWLSITNYQPTFGIGLWDAEVTYFENYMRISSDPEFVEGIFRTAYVTVISTSIEFVFGLSLALMFSRGFFGKRLLFPVMVIPLMIAPIVIGNNFWLMFSANGPINQMIGLITGTDFRVSWFSHRNYALMPIIVSEIWHWFPLTFLILLSGFTAIPLEELRAAEVLGASNWQVFWKIQLPKLKTVAIIALAIRSMEGLKIFDTIALLTRGGPGTLTQSISYMLFKFGFLYNRLSYISAGAWIILLACVLVFSIALRPVLRGEKG